MKMDKSRCIRRDRDMPRNDSRASRSNWEQSFNQSSSRGDDNQQWNYPPAPPPPIINNFNSRSLGIFDNNELPTSRNISSSYSRGSNNSSRYDQDHQSAFGAKKQSFTDIERHWFDQDQHWFDNKRKITNDARDSLPYSHRRVDSSPDDRGYSYGGMTRFDLNHDKVSTNSIRPRREYSDSLSNRNDYQYPIASRDIDERTSNSGNPLIGDAFGSRGNAILAQGSVMKRTNAVQRNKYSNRADTFCKVTEITQSKKTIELRTHSKSPRKRQQTESESKKLHPQSSVDDNQAVSARKKRNSPSDIRKSLYQKAIFILGKIANNEANGIVHELDETDKLKYTKIVKEYEERKKFQNDKNPVEVKTKSAKRKNTKGENMPPASSVTKRAFKDVVKDNMSVALVNSKKERLSPITVSQWGRVESMLSELVMKHVLNSTGSPVPHFDSSEVHRGFRIIKCLDEFSKNFLETSIAKVSNVWEDIGLRLIPAREIPMRPSARIWLPNVQIETPLILESLAKMNPNVPMDDWFIIATEASNNNSMSLVLSISEDGVAALEKLGNKLFFGIREAKVKILRPLSPDGEDDGDDIVEAK
ncbi:uncharacterized protein [Musca autumnalis]|uniref:uncharacterized protein n=1 Tax=Musca autumnalis TaxID=221902 RepID=UPI003CE9186C